MKKTKFGIITAKKPEFPQRDLLRVPYKKEDLTLSFPAFGPNTYRKNIESIGETYSHPVTKKQITFRPAQTSESISAIAYDFENMAKPQILDPRWLQAGPIVRTQEGVFTNIDETDESKLKHLLNKAEKVNGIYLLNRGIAFVPYDSFKTGVQDVDIFAQGGLARALEHTPEKVATNLREIASKKHYKREVNVWGFDPADKPVYKVASLGSDRNFDGGRLLVYGSWDDDGNGCAFGVLKNTGKASRAEK